MLTATLETSEVTMNKPIIKTLRRKVSKANKQTFQQLTESRNENNAAETTIYPSGAVLRQSINVSISQSMYIV